MERPTIQELRDAHAAISRGVRFKSPPISQALEALRGGIDELEEWHENFGNIEEWKKENKATDAEQAAA